MPEYGYWAHKVQLIYLARAIYPLHPPLEAGHVPIQMPPADAAQHLDVEGDRETVTRAIRAGRI
jgi:8-oxo-dGTP diphosphatase